LGGRQIVNQEAVNQVLWNFLLALIYIYPRFVTKKNVCLVLISQVGLGIISLSLLVRPGYTIPVNVPVDPEAPSATSVYLPLVWRADPILDDAPIWAHSEAPIGTEVTLFRHEFSSNDLLQEAELHIFADTRYEVWLDGAWLGRGSTRFSKTIHEYDIYPLGSLQAGEHLLAVLVQWAPNNRRSESTRPFLKAHVEGRLPGGALILASTGPQWKCQLSPAWQEDAAPVHSWGLIGPTELLDLRLLAADWNQPGYAGDNWSAAAVVDPMQPVFHPLRVPHRDAFGWLGNTTLDQPASPQAEPESPPEVQYRPSSMPLLANAPMTVTLKETGLLSPGFAVGELVPPVIEPSVYSFTASATATITIETLSTSAAPNVLVQVDEAALAWSKAGNARLDVYQASTQVAAGLHNLAFTQIPADGLTFAVSTVGLTFSDLPFGQGNHAGRRLLLAQPVSLSDVPSGLNLSFSGLPAYAVLDLGRTVHGRLSARVSGLAGSIVDIGWDERLAVGTQRPLPYPGSLHPQWNQVDSWVLDGSTRRITTLDARAGRYILIAAWGETPIQIQDIQVFEERYPLVQSGAFHSSEPLLDQIWQIGAETCLPNMTDAYADPWRERGQWWGDSYVVDHAQRVAYGSTGLLQRGVLLMADQMLHDPAPGMAPNNNGLHMLDYSMLWVHSLAEYGQQTGDMQTVTSAYLPLRQFMDHLAGYVRLDTGLLEIPYGVWGVTAYIDPYGHYSRYGQSAALNAMYYGTLLKAAQVADSVGDVASAVLWRERADRIKEGLNLYLYLPAEHRYLTHIYAGESYPPTPHALAWPLVYGLVPESEQQAVVGELLTMLSSDPATPNVQIYGMFWVLEALGQSGRIQEAMELIKTYYGYLINKGATTWWEGFDSDKYQWSSLSHGWGSAPTWFLTTYILGARQVAPDEWQVRPSLSVAGSAMGTLPLPAGTLQVDWSQPSCEEVQITLSVPPGTHGELILPNDGTWLVLTRNGEVVWQNGNPLAADVTLQAGELHIAFSAGSYVLRAIQECPLGDEVAILD